MATKRQSSSYPLPGVSLPNVNYGAYSQPRSGQTSAPASAMVDVLQGGQALAQRQEELRKQEEERKAREEQQIINRMQQVQTNADLWNLEQREVAKLNRTAGMLDNAQQDLRNMRAAEAKAEANMYNSLGQVVGGIGSLIGG